MQTPPGTVHSARCSARARPTEARLRSEHVVDVLAGPGRQRCSRRGRAGWWLPGLSPPRGSRPQPTQTTTPASVPSPGKTLDAELAAAIEPLMSGRRPFIRTADLRARVRDQFDDLHAKHGLDRRNDVYRASHIALYALYPLPSPPNRALTNEWAIHCQRSREIPSLDHGNSPPL
jgi:hypothetical protein